MTFFLNYIAKEKGYRSPLPAKDIILDISPTPPKKEKKAINVIYPLNEYKFMKFINILVHNKEVVCQNSGPKYWVANLSDRQGIYTRKC